MAYRLLGILAIVLCPSLSTWAQEIYYSPRWFGCVAQPVPTLRRAEIPSMPIVEAVALGGLTTEDRSLATYLDVEVPLVAKGASVRLYGYPLDAYRVSPRLAQERGMGSKTKGLEFGDLYLQTRIRLLRERANVRPSLILNITLKTASPQTVATRRFFDTPGYYFHLEGGKSFGIGNLGNNHRLRLGVMLGFMCWETTGSLQNDAYLYGVSLDADLAKVHLSAELSGYSGWMRSRYGANYGDRPITLRGSISYELSPRLNLLARYEYGLRDYPHQILGIGLRWQMPWDISKLLD